jgi:hypothetical protein
MKSHWMRSKTRSRGSVALLTRPWFECAKGGHERPESRGSEVREEASSDREEGLPGVVKREKKRVSGCDVMEVCRRVGDAVHGRSVFVDVREPSWIGRNPREAPHVVCRRVEEAGGNT